MKLNILLLTALCCVTGAVSAQTTAEFHTARGLPCTACHKGEVPKADVEREQCLQCHNEADLKKKGEAIKPKFGDLNPHDAHFVDLSCMECHKGHTANVNFCASCHGEHK